MSKNRRAPKECPKYVVHVKEVTASGGIKELFQYFQTQAEAKSWSAGRPGVKLMYKIIYDYLGEVK